MSAAAKAFREPYLVTEPPEAEEFESWEARQLRYAMYWAFFENTAYRNVHTWARRYRQDLGLYRYVRGIYNPAYRLGTIWQTLIWGGTLDADAGETGALPIEVGERAKAVEAQLRAAIALLWKTSNWASKKDLLTLQCSVKGDVGLEVVDDTERGNIYLRILPPEVIREVLVDDYGHVKGYVLEESRDDPVKPGSAATYAEEVSREGDDVVYRTYRNGQPFDWYGAADEQNGQERRGAEWKTGYGFVPMVVIQHIDVGLDWGWAEFHPIRGKVQEADDLASKLSDQIRKMVEGAWLFTGVKKASSTPGTGSSRDTKAYRETGDALDRPEPGREEMAIFYAADPGAGATSLVSPLDIASTSAYIKEVLADIERDHPELASDIWTASGDASGRALRVARQRAEAKARMRRTNYDAALVRAQQMAIAMGGWRGYEGYEGFGLDSYDQGLLDHSIANHPVFAQDPLDDLEIELAFWKSAEQAERAGATLEAFLERQGWTEEQIADFLRKVEANPDVQAKRQQQRLVSKALEGQGEG